MPANLYEILGIGRDVTSEDVRRAYRRKALETHPDRLPQGSSAAQKTASEDLFRKVNNAYEVLSDPQRRALYDQHGVWPPPTPQQDPFAKGPNHPFFRDPFSHDPFFRAPRMDPFGGFGYGSRHPGGLTDPFVLFNSIFGDFHRAFESDPFFDDPLVRRGFGSTSIGGGIFGSGFPSLTPFPFNDFGHGPGVGSSSRMQMFGNNGGNNGRWISQSWSSSTVDGVTHTRSVHKDSEGNEHVLYRYPDGTERRTVNGVEQSSVRPPMALPPPSAPPVALHPTQGAYLSPPPPPYSEVVAQQPFRSRSSKHHIRYDDHSGDRHRDRHRHNHPSRDKDREYGYGYRDDGHSPDAQTSSGRKPWRS